MTRIVTATDADFDRVVRPDDGRLVLVDFWADWCGPCKALAPVLDELAREYEDELTIAKVDIVANEATTKAVGVQNIPLLVVYRDGNEIARSAGGITKSRLAAFIDRHLA